MTEKGAGAPVWTWLILAAAGLKLGVALWGALAGSVAGSGAASSFVLPFWIDLLHVLVFGGAAAWLFVGGRRDPRALALGGVFLVTAAVFSNRLAAEVAKWVDGVPAAGISVLVALQLNAFLPYFFWSFAERFPRARPYGRAARLARGMVRTSLGAGAVLVAANLAAATVPELLARPPLGTMLRLLSRSEPSAYWPVVSLLTLSALPFIVWKSRYARREEQRRARLFLAALVLGFGPLFVEVLLHSLVPPFARFMDRPTSRLVGALVLYPLLLSTPFTTAYSVLVLRVLDVRLVVRKAIRYALARYTLIALTALPFFGLAAYVFVRRREPLVQILAGPGAVILIVLPLAGIVTMGLRVRILRALDRRFFREQYDVRHMLADLARSIRLASDEDEWAERLAVEVDRALHLHSLAALVLDRSKGVYRPVRGPGARELAGDSPLAREAVSGRAPLVIELEGRSSLRNRLSQEDLEWLADGGYQVLLPILASDHSPLALVALGEKKSDLPFTREDLALLDTLAQAAAVPLEYILEGTRGGDRAPVSPRTRDETDRPAHDCPRCGDVYPAATASCPVCGSELAEARVPPLLAGKFRIEHRLGAGGMSVVYRARDLDLDRPVAVKALPRISAERSLRLRREARAMAAVAHGNLASIHGIESWHGVPFLVLELLEGGTLEERIAAGPLMPREVLELGIDVARGLERIHASGILHRDIKPSNIGFTADGTPKILDFGIARILAEIPEPPPMEGVRPSGLDAQSPSDVRTMTQLVVTEVGTLVGTPLYMSPEALGGAEPDPSFDLWSLAVALWEAAAGRNPFESVYTPGGHWTSHRPPPDPSELGTDCPPGLSAFLERALSPVRQRRPQSAREMRSSLQALT